MPHPPRTIAFVTVATDHGTMIVNRFDQLMTEPNRFIGAGFQLLNKASYDSDEVGLMLRLLDLRRTQYGDGLVAIDCGANLGVHTVEWARHMTGWGVVMAIEAQERIYYALAGNIAINNCFNACAIHAAVSSQTGTMKMPKPNYLTFSSFGSLELRKGPRTEFIGQPIDYSEDKMVDVQTINLDSLNLPRLDLIKIDVEGMELDVLRGAAKCIVDRQPLLLVETLKADAAGIRVWLENLGYTLFALGLNVLAVHKNDKCIEHIKFTEPPPR